MPQPTQKLNSDKLSLILRAKEGFRKIASSFKIIFCDIIKKYFEVP